jgi:N-acetylmuramoyl-L-alanine amidase
VSSPAEQAPAGTGKVTAVRFWSLGEVTRVAIEVSSDFKYRHDRLPNPDRLFFDIQGARPAMAEKKMYTIAVGDPLLKQIRVAETQPGVTRVVLDLEPHDPQVEFTASQLSNPARLMLELRLKDHPAPPLTTSVSGSKALADAPVQAPSADLTAAVPAPASTLVAVSTPVSAPPPLLAKPEPRPYRPPAIMPVAPSASASYAFKADQLAIPPMAVLVTPQVRAPNVPPRTLPPPLAKADLKPDPKPDKKPAVTPLPARRATGGDESMTRVLGLKLGRVVIDPGHGGHDVGTHGPSGLYEKDVVLDVAQRLGALLEARLGSEVVYTRDDDTYIPLEQRTAIANDHKADLFLSIHANSSPIRSAAGVETYYLNFTTSKTALDLAARENAGAQSSVFDLKEVLQKIAMKDKIDESREFALRIQNSLFAIESKGNTAAKNRGVKRAPFVVLIGASMPSVLAEIGFLTNAADEAVLRRPDQRQKIAEALYKGIANYADSLSHFQVASRE